MPKKCVICRTEASPACALAFHCFPKDAIMRSKWIEALKLEFPINFKTNFVCSNNFDDTCYSNFDEQHARLRLRAGAVPTLQCNKNRSFMFEKHNKESQDNIKKLYVESSEMQQNKCNKTSDSYTNYFSGPLNVLTTAGISGVVNDMKRLPENQNLNMKWDKALPGKIIKTSVVSPANLKSDVHKSGNIRKKLQPGLVPSILPKSEDEVCRFCLATDGKMFSLQQGQLKNCIESVAGLSNMLMKDCLPQYVCYECKAHVLKYYKFIEKSMIAQATLLEILEDNGQITKSHVRITDRKALNLLSMLNPEPASILVCIDSQEPRLSSQEIFFECPVVKLEKIDCYDNKNEECHDNNNVKIINEDTSIAIQINNKNLCERRKIIKPQNSNENGKQIIDMIKCEVRESTSHDMIQSNFISLVGKEKKDSEISDIDYTNNTDGLTDNENEDEDKETPSSIKVKKKIKSRDKVFCELSPKRTKKMVLEGKTSSMGERDALTPDEMAVQKLANCFDIVDLSLQEQIQEWKNEVEQPSSWLHGEVFKCEICLKKLPSKSAHEKHSGHHRRTRGDYLCPVCKERYKCEKRLFAHTVRTHSKKYVCKNCSKVFRNYQTANRHAKHHSGKLYLCPRCPYYNRHQSVWRKHVRGKHAHAHHCARCGGAFVSAMGLAIHARKHPDQVDEPKETFRCEECKVDFHSGEARNVHYLTTAQHKTQSGLSSELQNSCKFCGAKFDSKVALRGHLLSVHMRQRAPRIQPIKKPGNECYPKPCEHCGEEMETRQKHFRHVVRRHRHLRHTYKPLYTVICEQCGKGFSNKAILNVHKLRHGSPKVSCPLCPRKFYDRYALARHGPAHSTEKPYACQICRQTFKFQRNLHKHVKQCHSTDVELECKLCDKSFKYTESLKQHIKHVHQKIPWPRRVRNRQEKQPDENGDPAL